jgi:hypothetical protein
MRPGGVASTGAPRLPPPVGRLGLFAEEFAGAVERSRDLARHYAAVADARSCPWLDAGCSREESTPVSSWPAGAQRLQKLLSAGVAATQDQRDALAGQPLP